MQGRCYTCGWELLLKTELRVAARDTRFAMLEVRRGFYACGGATLRLPMEIGWANASATCGPGRPETETPARGTGVS